jgi:hypothetical protein
MSRPKFCRISRKWLNAFSRMKFLLTASCIRFCNPGLSLPEPGRDLQREELHCAETYGGASETFSRNGDISAV